MKLWPELRRAEWVILGVLVVLYLGTRLFHLTSFPIFVDEAIYSRWAQIGLHDATWRFISLTDGKQPLFMWTAMGPLKLFSDPLFATRFVSAISGLVTMLGVWYAGWLLENKKVGFIAAVLVLITPFLFFYDRFAVVESMLTASGVVLFILGIILIRTVRLDAALILGISGGFALLVKSPALIYLLLIPVMYPFVREKFVWKDKSHLKFAALFILACAMAATIYNIQRLSPWMHMIGEKNDDFVISPLKMLTDHPYRIWQNFADAMKWLLAYITVPIFVTSVGGGIWLLRDNWRKFMVVSAWFWGPLMATVLTALLFRPRYIVFAVPFMLLYAAYMLSKMNVKMMISSLCICVLIPGYFFYQAWFNPLHMPLAKADWDYTSGWAAGNGVKEISDWLVSRVKETKKDADVYTEGTFGLLPHGVELYTSDRTRKIHVTGIYPVVDIPPLEVRQNAEKNSETYFILNNTQVTALPPNSTEILSFKKADESYIRLYRISP
jgi:4-amino-4-deoxy-L-arabinose transferase-like glycosyltransferase